MFDIKVDINNLKINDKVSILGANRYLLYKGVDKDGKCLLRSEFGGATVRTSFDKITERSILELLTHKKADELKRDKCLYVLHFSPIKGKCYQRSPRRYCYIGFTGNFHSRMKAHASNRFDKHSLKYDFNVDEYKIYFRKIIDLPEILPSDDCKVIETWCMLKSDTRVINNQIMDNHKMDKKNDLFYCLHYFDNVTDVVEYFVALNK